MVLFLPSFHISYPQKSLLKKSEGFFVDKKYERKEEKVPNSPSFKNRVIEKGIVKVVYHPRQIYWKDSKEKQPLNYSYSSNY